MKILKARCRRVVTCRRGATDSELCGDCDVASAAGSNAVMSSTRAVRSGSRANLRKCSIWSCGASDAPSSQACSRRVSDRSRRRTTGRLARTSKTLSPGASLHEECTDMSVAVISSDSAGKERQATHPPKAAPETGNVLIKSSRALRCTSTWSSSRAAA